MQRSRVFDYASCVRRLTILTCRHCMPLQCSNAWQMLLARNGCGFITANNNCSHAESLQTHAIQLNVAVRMEQAGKGSATLSMAYAAAEFGNSCLKAMAGEKSVTECAYIDSHVTDVPYFATKVTLGPEGVQVQISFHTPPPPPPPPYPHHTHTHTHTQRTLCRVRSIASRHDVDVTAPTCTNQSGLQDLEKCLDCLRASTTTPAAASHHALQPACASEGSDP